MTVGRTYSEIIEDALGVARPIRDTNPKSAHGATKPSLALIPGTALVAEAVVFGLGAKKYGPYNWRIDPVSSMTYLNAALRHIHSAIDGEDIDPESGESNLAHARACMAILIDAAACNSLVDDRPPAAPTSDHIRVKTLKVAS